MILDNIESILEAGNLAGNFKANYESYSQFFGKMASVSHQSCLLITSREKICSLDQFEGKNKPVRSLRLKGLNSLEGRLIFDPIGNFQGSDKQWKKLVEFYNGNPLALELAAHHIQEEFAGKISNFLEEGKQVFADLRELLDKHFERLSNPEREIMYWLCILREPVSISNLKEYMVSLSSKERVSENLRSLQIRIPLERSEQGNRFTLQPVLIEYITDKFIETVSQELKTDQFELLNNHALLLASSRDYVREMQIRTILEPVKQRLIEEFNGQPNLEKHLNYSIAKLRKSAPLKPGYIGGNILNLLNHLKTNLNGYNFSHLALWEAYVLGVNLQNVNFSDCEFKKSVFTQSFGGIHSLAFSPDGKALAVGDSEGRIRLLRLEVAFSPDGKFLVSGSEDCTLRLWEISTGNCLRTFQESNRWVWSVRFSPNGKLIASGSDDGHVTLWDADTGEYVQTLREHTEYPYSF